MNAHEIPDIAKSLAQINMPNLVVLTVPIFIKNTILKFLSPTLKSLTIYSPVGGRVEESGQILLVEIINKCPNLEHISLYNADLLLRVEQLPVSIRSLEITSDYEWSKEMGPLIRLLASIKLNYMETPLSLFWHIPDKSLASLRRLKITHDYHIREQLTKRHFHKFEKLNKLSFRFRFSGSSYEPSASDYLVDLLDCIFAATTNLLELNVEEGPPLEIHKSVSKFTHMRSVKASLNMYESEDYYDHVNSMTIEDLCNNFTNITLLRIDIQNFPISKNTLKMLKRIPSLFLYGCWMLSCKEVPLLLGPDSKVSALKLEYMRSLSLNAVC
jgi:hypothetical protein